MTTPEVAEPSANERLTGEALEDAVVEAYNRGEPILDIERRLQVPRSTLYWILHKRGVSASRTQHRRRVTTSDAETVKALYHLIEHLEARIHELEHPADDDTSEL